MATSAASFMNDGKKKAGLLENIKKYGIFKGFGYSKENKYEKEMKKKKKQQAYEKSGKKTAYGATPQGSRSKWLKKEGVL